MMRPTRADCPMCGKIVGISRLLADELVIQLKSSVVLLGPWQYYPGYCVVVSKSHARELHELGAEREAFLADMSRTAQAIVEVFEPLKLNYEMLGNRVEHPHWHLFPRSAEDANKLAPVWIELAKADTSPADKERLMTGPTTRRKTADRLREWFAKDKR